MYPPGFRTRSASRAHCSHHSWNGRPAERRLSTPAARYGPALVLCPSPFGVTSSARSVRARAPRPLSPMVSHALPMNPIAYGGSVQMASIDASGSSRIRSMQSPWITR